MPRRTKVTFTTSWGRVSFFKPNPLQEDQPAIVLIPAVILGERFHRIAFFLGFGACLEMVAVEDSGLLIGKSRKLSIIARNRGKQFTFPAQSAIFGFEGGIL
jgi:hypothetical protein